MIEYLNQTKWFERKMTDSMRTDWRDRLLSRVASWIGIRVLGSRAPNYEDLLPGELSKATRLARAEKAIEAAAQRKRSRHG